jgi:hypothetical protein
VWERTLKSKKQNKLPPAQPLDFVPDLQQRRALQFEEAKSSVPCDLRDPACRGVCVSATSVTA